MDKDKIKMTISLEGNQGERNYMEDVADMVLETEPERRVFLAIFDGHGGKEAANFAKKHLWENIKEHKSFNSENPLDVKLAITDGFLTTHNMMFEAHGSWPKRRLEMNSTSGTTATIAIIKSGYLFIGHVGDSGVVLVQKSTTDTDKIKTRFLTKFHKPESKKERRRIESLGGKVAMSKGINRVVWKREVQKRSSHVADSQLVCHEYIPFLAVSRSLGDCWSYVPEKQQFLVSPRPDVSVKKLEPGVDQFLVLASDGLWGVLDDAETGRIVSNFKPDPRKDPDVHDISHCLIEEALRRGKLKKSRADNISTIVVEFNNCVIDQEELVPTDEESEETPPQVYDLPSDFDTRPRLVRKLAFRCTNEEEAQRTREFLDTPPKRKCVDSETHVPAKSRKSDAEENQGGSSQGDGLITQISQETLDSLHFDDNSSLNRTAPDIFSSDASNEVIPCTNLLQT